MAGQGRCQRWAVGAGAVTGTPPFPSVGKLDFEEPMSEWIRRNGRWIAPVLIVVILVALIALSAIMF